MQQYYDEESILYNYLCCYVSILDEENGVMLHNSIADTYLKLSGKKETINLLLGRLQQGIGYEDLLDNLGGFSSDREALYRKMICLGMIE